jgi:hypothetical protein|nr:MAG TPA: upper collar protein [Caudoviricetes sp.]
MAKRKNYTEYQLRVVDYYRHYMERLLNIVLAQFDWKGLPDTVDRWYLEMCLAFYGTAAMYKAKDTDLLFASNYTAQGLTMYGYPAHIRGVTNGGYDIVTGMSTGGTIDVEPGEFVVLYDTMTRTPLWKTLDIYAKMLTKVSLAIDLNLQQQYRPYILVGNTDNKALRKTFETFLDGVAAYEPALFSTMDPDDIKTIDLNVPYKGMELEQQRQAIWTDAMSELGITIGTTKKERMLGDEIATNREADLSQLNSRLKNRKEFAEKINEKFDLDVEVELTVRGDVDDFSTTFGGGEPQTYGGDDYRGDRDDY